jgi:hypothetical protein
MSTAPRHQGLFVRVMSCAKRLSSGAKVWLFYSKQLLSSFCSLLKFFVKQMHQLLPTYFATDMSGKTLSGTDVMIFNFFRHIFGEKNWPFCSNYC